jgi:alpha-L-fucosidase
MAGTGKSDADIVAPVSRSLPAAVLLAVVLGGPARAGVGLDRQSKSNAAATSRNAAARREFQDAKLGLFIHWGVYSLLGKGEWVMNNDKIPIREYAKLPPRFNPAKFDAEAWVKLAKAAGAKYITITSKHHDGFCMFASKLTDYDIVDSTPYHRDPLQALAEACHQQEIKLFFYYSLLDWHHPDYFPLGKTGHTAGRPASGDWKRYVAYYQGQLRELCTGYGEIGGIWLDGWWDRPEADWDLAGTYGLIHKLQPGALVGNNHHVAPMPGEDFQIFEQDVPGKNSAGFNKAAVAADLPLETCLTINRSWGYRAGDRDFKSVEQLVHALVGAAGRGANLLLNVGPRPDGTIGPEFTERLLGLGKWLAAFGESVYGTRRGPFPPQPWGVSTAKGKQDHPTEIFLHVLTPREDAPIIFVNTAISWTPHLFGKTTSLKLAKTQRGLVLDLPQDLRMPNDTIIVLNPVTIGR